MALVNDNGLDAARTASAAREKADSAALWRSMLAAIVIGLGVGLIVAALRKSDGKDYAIYGCFAALFGAAAGVGWNIERRGGLSTFNG